MWQRGSVGQQGSSFSEEKEAKRLCKLGASLDVRRVAELTEVFWFFFSKKNVSLLTA
jgi:hypothetical protein